jgi:hypothetical protein
MFASTTIWMEPRCVGFPVEPFCGIESCTGVPGLQVVPGGFGGTDVEELPLHEAVAMSNTSTANGHGRGRGTGIVDNLLD